MMQYLQVAEDEADSPLELPSEEDGTVLLSTLAAQFPGACGLKYRNEETGNLRGLRLIDGRIHPPADLWGNSIYFVVYPKENKRKGDDYSEYNVSKMKRAANERKCSDLIVLGLPYNCEKDDLTSYFSEYGTLIMAEVKKDPKTNAAKGYGFIRFAEYDAQIKAMSRRHMIGGRPCDVKIPNSKEGSAEVNMSRKIFVGRCTEDMTPEQLKSYFEKFGEVTDVFIPKPFRAFAFVSFTDPHVAAALCGEDHIISGISCHISNAVPKGTKERQQQPPSPGYGPGGSYTTHAGNQSWAPDTNRQATGGWGAAQSPNAGMMGNNANQPAAAAAAAAAGMGNMMSMMNNPAFLAAAFAASQGMFGAGSMANPAAGGAAAPVTGQQGMQQQQLQAPPPPPTQQGYGAAAGAANGSAQRWAPQASQGQELDKSAGGWVVDANTAQQWR